jgi:GTP diphosphokinase / guanosine-3',5'-bis(diphosphate) 3'-diphosphatase
MTEMNDKVPNKLKDVDLDAMMKEIIDAIETYLPGFSQEWLCEVYRFGKNAHEGQLRKSGEPYFIHALTVAGILAELRLDIDTIAAALLHDVVEDTPVTIDDVRNLFGKDVAHMVDGVTKISDIRSHNPETRKAENYRKLVFSTARDPRTVLIKLADRLHNMRTVEYLAPERQMGMARETMDVYAPLAHRFGLAKIKWELEDRSFKVLSLDKYFEVERGIKETRTAREKLIEDIGEPLRKALTAAGIEAEILGRPKHFYSIYNKMKAQDIPLDQVYDLLALRVLVRTKVECYHALGIVHSLFTPLQDRIKDYIANPKPNMYQSLHTTIKGPGGRFLEIQIRTYEMHERSEIGIAAHWKYKEGGQREEIDFSSMVNWLRQIMHWQEDVADPREFMESMQIDLFQDEVFVFSPKGDIFQFPKGATPLDFAFEIHSEVGLHCVGAKVNGRIISLSTPLENHDTVEIMTAKRAHASTSWLHIVKTVKAKHHIRKWIRTTQFADSMKLGREILERELKRQKIVINIDKDLVGVSQQLGYIELDRMLAAIGAGDLTYQRVLNRLEPPEKKKPEKLKDLGRELYSSILRKRITGVRIQGIDSMMVRYARCCEPIPGDEVQGVVTRGRGVSVHRVGCVNLKSSDPERLIEVTWDAAADQTFLVKLMVIGVDRKGLLADISEAITSLGTNIQGGDFKSDEGVANVSFLVEVSNLNNLQKVLNAVKRVPNVQKVDRYQI